ncbi:hypothetical protein C7212DRAFT_361978 [Tuber magnatum]|uniref:Uncharacterized protein n=1 Tax=Tuber magnatum TaxID=42249 RepID=A0A317T017_9PEZI|nr:hypothetical protein C7212DRAFT_361978 [Tuber magnatum]
MVPQSNYPPSSQPFQTPINITQSTLPRGGTPPPPTAATTLSDGPIELPIWPPSPAHRPIQNAFENNPLPPLNRYSYFDPSVGRIGDVVIENIRLPERGYTEYPPAGPGGFKVRFGRLSKRKRFWVFTGIFLGIAILFAIVMGVLLRDGNRNKIDSSSLTSRRNRSTTQPPAPSALNVTPNSIVTDGTTTTTPTKRITTVTSTIRPTQTPSGYTNFELWTGAFDTVSPLVSSSGTCKTRTSTNALQECAENARFTTTIAEFKTDGYAVGTTLWLFRDYLVPMDRSGRQWYYSGNSIEKKYSHASSPGCEVVETAELWLGSDGAYVLAVNYESTNECTLDGGRAKNPTAQVCECTYEGVFATVSRDGMEWGGEWGGFEKRNV